jgi:hypothetical protein
MIWAELFRVARSGKQDAEQAYKVKTGNGHGRG